MTSKAGGARWLRRRLPADGEHRFRAIVIGFRYAELRRLRKAVAGFWISESDPHLVFAQDVELILVLDGRLPAGG